MSTTAMPYEHLGHALATDYFLVRETFTDEQSERFPATRFVHDEVLPVINDYWERAELPWPLFRRLAELGVVGEDIEGFGCPAMSPPARGLVHMEVNRGDGSLGTFLHSGRAGDEGDRPAGRPGFCCRTTSSATWVTSRPSIPSKAPRRCRR
jgi:glutaryl-CoA dehydrogenase